jgi:hypothetical protein
MNFLIMRQLYEVSGRQIFNEDEKQWGMCC